MNSYLKVTTAETDELYLPSCVIVVCFRISRNQSPIDCDGDNSDEEYSGTSAKLSLTYTIQEIDIRRTLIDFRRYFLSGSIVGGCLRSTDSVRVAIDLSDGLANFLRCSHKYDEACNACRTNLLLASNSAEELFHSGARIPCAISSVTLTTKGILASISLS